MYFFLLETIPLSIDFGNNLRKVFEDLNLDVIVLNTQVWVNANNILWAFYPIIQAAGMLYVKESKDPL